MNDGTRSETFGLQPAEHELVLFVRGSTPASNTAIHQLRHFCAERFRPGSWQLEIVDLHDTPDAADTHKILATPTVLIRNADKERRFVGDIRFEAGMVN